VLGAALLTRAVLPVSAAIVLASCDDAAGERAGASLSGAQAVDPFAAQPDFFPLGVYFQSPRLAPEWAKLGINMIAPANGALTRDTLARMDSLGMVVGGRISDFVNFAGSRETVPFMVAEDEPDNAQAKEDGSFGPCLSPEELAAESSRLRARSSGMPVLRNFGRGVVEPHWVGRGACAGRTDDYYPAAIASADIVSFDHYPVLEGTGLERVAQGARNLRAYIAKAGGGQAQWGVIEVSAIKGGRAPTPAEVRSMAWMQIINGAKGLIFFPWHVGEDGERIREDALFADPAAVAGLKALTAEITALSPVLKAGADIRARVESSQPHSAIARRYRGDAYVFIVNESSQAADVAVSLDGIERAARPEALGSARQPQLSGSRLLDRLEPYEPKIYRMTGIGT
jgi:hypothetical protein